MKHTIQFLLWSLGIIAILAAMGPGVGAQAPAPQASPAPAVTASPVPELSPATSTPAPAPEAAPASSGNSGAPEGKTGPKLRLAVLKIDPKAGGSGDAGEVIREMIITALVNSGKYLVVERAELDNVIKEQNLGTSGAVTPESAAKAGKLLGAQVMIAGAITEFTRFSSGSLFSVGPFGVGGKSAKLTVDLRLIDATTGQIIAAQSASGNSSTAAVAGGVPVGNVTVIGGFAKNDPMGAAARDAVGKAINIIASQTKDLKWQARIMKREDNTVYLNSGGNDGVAVGDNYTVYAKGEDLIDPDTGLVLASQEKAVGKITVTEIKDKYAMASIVSEDKTLGEIKTGDFVR